jgi:AcrR family transcriptional regulator
MLLSCRPPCVYTVNYSVNIALHRKLVNMLIEEDASAERRPPVTRERVLRAAVELADEGGIDAVSMRKLGQRLGVEAMAIYRHVRGKDDLLDGLVEVVLAEIEPSPPNDDWKAAVRDQAIAARRVMLRHRWAPRLLEERAVGGPAFLGHVESVLATLLGAGFSIEVAHHALHVLSSRLFGFQQDLFDDSPKPGSEPPPTPVPPPALDRYPSVSRLARAVSHDGGLGYCDDDVEFAFGLDLILDGFDRLRGAKGAT